MKEHYTQMSMLKLALHFSLIELEILPQARLGETFPFYLFYFFFKKLYEGRIEQIVND